MNKARGYMHMTPFGLNGDKWFVSSMNEPQTEYWADGEWHEGPHAILDTHSWTDTRNDYYVNKWPFCQIALRYDVIFIGRIARAFLSVFRAQQQK